jgi:hypothetical protein
MATTKTIKSSGGDYTTLALWQAAIKANLTGTGVAEAVLYDVSDAGLQIDGWTTTASDYIYIHSHSTYRHAGVWDAAKAVVSKADGSAIIISEDFVRLDGFQITTTSPTMTARCPINTSGINAGSDLRISNMIIKGHGANYVEYGIYLNDADINAYLWNLLIYGQHETPASRGILINNAGAVSLYSSTVIASAGGRGIYRVAGTVTAKNVYSRAASGMAFSGTIGKTNCASADTTADGTSPLVSIALSTTADSSHAGFVDITGGEENFKLKGGSALLGSGYDTHGESAPLGFDTDLAGNARSGAWFIGALGNAGQSLLKVVNE